VTEQKHVEVAVVTTSGTYPTHGLESEPAQDRVQLVLDKAASALHLTGTSNWIAKVKGREIDANRTYVENDLQGKVDVDWGPREGGGGAR